jgi:hypothetical protein
MSWFWEIQQSDSGPHYYLTLEFAVSSEQLIEWVEPLLNTYQRDESGYRCYLWHHIDSGAWYYTAVEIRDGYLLITRGGGNDHPAVDAFLQPLLSEPRFPIRRWRVSAGGEGYGTKYFRSGIDVASFQRYCAGEAKTPNFPQVLQCLKQALSNLEPDTPYTLGEPEIQGNTMTVPVLYSVPFKDGAWLADPAGQELDSVAREVSDRCDVPALASAASLHEPNNFEQVIGGSFYFGYK